MTTRSCFAMMRMIGAGVVLASAVACTTNPFGPTTDTVSSTSDKTWWTEDGLLRPDFKPAAFVTFNQENLRHDIAAGHGEYLTSMSVLLGVPADRQPAFFSAMQARATDEAGATLATPDILLATLRTTAAPYLP